MEASHDTEWCLPNQVGKEAAAIAVNRIFSSLFSAPAPSSPPSSPPNGASTSMKMEEEEAGVPNDSLASIKIEEAGDG